MKETDHRVERSAVVAPHPGARRSHIFAVNIDQLRVFYLQRYALVLVSQYLQQN